MSGNRSLHRELVSQGAPIWQVHTLVDKTNWMVWTACADGNLNGFEVQEKEGLEDLNAAAMTLDPKYALKGNSLLGCTQVCVMRNYMGDDDTAGDVIVASLDLGGRVRVWNITEQQQQESTKPTQDFSVENSSGTTLALCSPKLFSQHVMVAALGCIDGSVSIVSTGVEVPNHQAKSVAAAGTELEKWGSSGAAIATRLRWHPTTSKLLAVGRSDGIVDLFLEGKRWHRFVRHVDSVRGAAFTPDGQLLITGCDHGMVCVWDFARKALVHHVIQAHSTWILDLIPLPDSRRYATCGSDGLIHLWSLTSQAPLHTFSTEGDTPWTIHATSQNRLVAGTEKGWLQVFSIE